MASATTPALTLNSGVAIPALGLGVFQSTREETAAAVRAALSAGYRHVDTAAAYGNEREVCEAIRASGLDRSDVFIETKIWISDYGYETTLHGFEKSAGKLGVSRSTCSSCTSRCPRRSSGHSRRTAPSRPCWPTARSARSA